MSAETPRPIVRFGVFELDLHARELRKHGVRVKLSGQAYDVLVMLLDRPGEPVWREDIQKRLWSDDTFVDFEAGVNSAIRRIREALADTSGNSRYIETLRGQGYRFVSPVSVHPKLLHKLESGTVGIPPPATAGATSGSDSGSTSSLYRRTTAIAASVLLLTAAAGLVWRMKKPASPAPAGVQSIAVLPFRDFSPVGREPYLADGMTESLISDLGKMGTLRVIARTSAMTYQSTRKPLGEIARELNVDAIIEGSVSRSAERVRIIARLIGFPGEAEIWSDSFERDAGDLLTLQKELARAIAQRIRFQVANVAIEPSVRKRSVSPAALDSYLRGRYAWNQRGEEDLLKSIGHFEDALIREPAFAEAYAGLAESYVVIAILGVRPPVEAFRAAERAARRALELDPSLAAAHSVLADTYKSYYYDWSSADREYRRALELGSGYATAYQWYADFLSAAGRHGEAVAKARRAQELDPLSPITNGFVGFVMARAGQIEQAVSELRSVTQTYPSFALGHWFLAIAYEQKKEWKQSLLEINEALALAPRNPLFLGTLGRLHAQAGDRASATHVVKQLRRSSGSGGLSSYCIAQVYASLGDTTTALDFLEKAFDERAVQLIYIPSDRSFDLIRTDRRYAALLDRMRLGESLR